MKAMIYKDIVSVRKLLFWWIFLVLVYGVIFIPQGNLTIFVFLGIAFSNSFILNVMTENFHSGWYSFLLTTPAKRNTIVNSIYLEGILSMFIALLVSILVTIIVMLITKTPLSLLMSPENILISILFIFYSLFAQSLQIFISFKYNVKTAQTVSLVGYLMIFCFVFLIIKLFEITGFTVQNTNSIYLLLVLLILFLLVGYWIFYYLTRRTVRNKDF